MVKYIGNQKAIQVNRIDNYYQASTIVYDNVEFKYAVTVQWNIGNLNLKGQCKSFYKPHKFNQAYPSSFNIRETSITGNLEPQELKLTKFHCKLL